LVLIKGWKKVNSALFLISKMESFKVFFSIFQFFFFEEFFDSKEEQDFPSLLSFIHSLKNAM